MASHFDAVAVLDAVQAILEGLGTLTTVQRGIPLELPTTATGLVGLGAPDVTRRGGPLCRLAVNVYVEFGYRTVGDLEKLAEAETAIAATFVAFARAVLADPQLGGVAVDSAITPATPDEPLYSKFVGVEYRRFALIVKAWQDENLALVV